MKLSACVIVKNEEANLPNWLSCMARAADEMVVVDTGSVDRTREIAAQAGARVYEYAWQKDFAAAKNYALEQAEGDWILFLDADEYFSEATLNRLRRDMERYHRDTSIGVILCRLINIDRDRNDKIIDTLLQSRIFRRKKAIRYAGRVHEQLQNSGSSLKMVINNDWTIYHTGYSVSILREKSRRDLEILQVQLSQAASQKARDKLAPYLMDVYNSLGEYEKAIQYARQGLKANIVLLGMEGHYYEVIFSAMQRAGYSYEQQLALLEEAMAKHPEEGCFPMEKGYVLWQLKDYLSAEKYLEQGLAMRQEFEKKLVGGQLSTDSTLRLLPHVYQALGDIARKKGDRAKAADLFFAGLQVYKYSAALLAGLYSCLEGSKAAEIIELLNTIYDRQQDGDFVASALEGQGSGELIAYYRSRRHSGAGLENAKPYLLLGRYDAAAVAAGDRLQFDSNFLLCRLFAQEDSSLQETKAQAHRLRGYLSVLLGSRYQAVLQNPAGNTLEARAVQRLLAEQRGQAENT